MAGLPCCVAHEVPGQWEVEQSGPRGPRDHETDIVPPGFRRGSGRLPRQRFLWDHGLVDEVAADAPLEDQPGEPHDDTAEPEFPPAGFERWRRESALGTVGTGIVRGLQNVFGTPQDQIVMVAPVPGGPPDPDRLQVILDPDDPTKSIAVLPAAAADDDAPPAQTDSPPSPPKD
jgi:hypothetical protein